MGNKTCDKVQKQPYGHLQTESAFLSNADSTDQVTNKWCTRVFYEFDSADKYLQQDTISEIIPIINYQQFTTSLITVMS